MAKLTLLTLAFAAALVAIATAHTTIVTTTIEDDNPISSQRQCSQRLQGQRLNQCRTFLEQGQMGQQQQEVLQQCCQELQNVDEECQCEAVKKVFRQVQQEQQQQQQGSRFGSQQTQQLKQKAQILPNVCNLQSRQCQIGNIITTVTESNMDIFDWPFGTGSGSQQCKQTEIQRPVNQCQRFVEQQMRSPKQGQRRQQQQQQQQPGLQECCKELQNVKRDCQCEAIKEVAKRVMQQQQQGWQQQGGQQMEIARKIMEDLPNQCYLEVQQCNIPYGMM